MKVQSTDPMKDDPLQQDMAGAKRSLKGKYRHFKGEFKREFKRGWNQNTSLLNVSF